MTEKSKVPRAPGSPGKLESAPDGDWTKGLKKLYDSVVDEPLPDTFTDLLAKLDSED